jgi:16S rRNA A1518/A1519 N6-dimethyltransferase RsmA/KsgA/DIM1 with predicted DNA glycosylase/AP lyase activity
MDLEQHMTVDVQPFRRVLAGVNLQRRAVLEIGAGTGVLTQLILDVWPRTVTAFEIEPGLCPIRHTSLVLREEDAMAAALAVIDWDCLISAPPYGLLPRLADLLVWMDVEDAILLIPEKQREFWFSRGFHVVEELKGSAFSPPSRGVHLIVQRGFSGSW